MSVSFSGLSKKAKRGSGILSTMPKRQLIFAPNAATRKVGDALGESSKQRELFGASPRQQGPCDPSRLRSPFQTPAKFLRYWPAFLPPSQATRLFEAASREVRWSQHRIRIFGREQDCPRLSAWYGDPGAAYAYSGIAMKPQPWTAALVVMRRHVEALLGQRFNGVLVNLYRDGRDSMGWHADDERELGNHPLVASLSLGGVRRFCLRERCPGDQADLGRVELELEHGSLLLLERGAQALYHHSLPKTRKTVGPRINLTFRQIAERA